MIKIYNWIMNLLFDRCPCGGKIEFDGYKDRCNKGCKNCGK